MTTTVETLAEAARPALPPTPICFDDFLAWRDQVRAEWVDGEVVPLSPNSLDHQMVALFLARLLAAFIEAGGLGDLLIAPFLMRLSTHPRGREPDLLFVAEEHADRIRDTYLDGAADLAIEIVSPESDARDRGEKFVEYEGAGIPEYWLIDPLRKEAFFYRLGADGRYHLGPIEAEGLYRSAVLPGFWLRVAWLWQRPLPSVAEITRQLEV